MYSLVEAMARLFMEIGGRIHTGTPVQRIVVQKGKAVGVEAADGFHPAELVVSNADPGYTYQHLVDPAWRRRWTDRRIARLHYSMSCFLLYLGVRRTYPQLLHHTLILSPRYRELIEDIFERKVLAPDFSLYLHAPTRTDPTMAPPGCESLYVLAPVPHLQASVDWTEEAPRYAGRLLEFLEAWGLEGLQENLEVCHYFTPEDFARHLNAPYGSAFSIEPRLTQTAYFRPHNRSEDIRGLYLVGAGTHPGAGLPGVVLSAEATAWAIAQDYNVTSPSTAASPRHKPAARRAGGASAGRAVRKRRREANRARARRGATAHAEDPPGGRFSRTDSTRAVPWPAPCCPRSRSPGPGVRARRARCPSQCAKSAGSRSYRRIVPDFDVIAVVLIVAGLDHHAVTGGINRRTGRSGVVGARWGL